MDDKEREEYWKTLVSLKGADYKAETEELLKAIKRPRYLYRYRGVTPRTLEALRANKLYYSTSDYYDDPFDTFVNPNLSELRTIFEQLKNNSAEDIESIINRLLRMIGLDCKQLMMDQYKSLLIDALNNDAFQENVMNYVRNIRNELKKGIWSVCFSESGVNEVLWLKYAQQHKGFALRYDLENEELIKCGKKAECENCNVFQSGTSLYPIYYSKEVYDSTRFAQLLCFSKLLGLDIVEQELLKKIMGVTNWEIVRIATIKKECHRYDKEWRLIYNGITTNSIVQEWIPDAVILGLNMNEGDRNLVTALAANAGVKKIYQCTISDDGALQSKMLD